MYIARPPVSLNHRPLFCFQSPVDHIVDKKSFASDTCFIHVHAHFKTAQLLLPSVHNFDQNSHHSSPEVSSRQSEKFALKLLVCLLPTCLHQAIMFFLVCHRQITKNLKKNQSAMWKKIIIKAI